MRQGRQQFLQHHAVPLIGAVEMEVQLGDEPARVLGEGIERHGHEAVEPLAEVWAKEVRAQVSSEGVQLRLDGGLALRIDDDGERVLPAAVRVPLDGDFDDPFPGLAGIQSDA